MLHEDRIKIATALGYYARATDPEAASLSAAIQAHALAEYRNDIDCQIAFRKGYQQADEHLREAGPEAEELRELGKEVRRLIKEVYEMRGDLARHAGRYTPTEPAKYSTPPGGWANGGGGGGGGGPMIAIDHDGMGGCRITEIGGGGAAGGGGGGEAWKCGRTEAELDAMRGEWKRPLGIMDQRFFMRRMDTGQLFCQDGKPVSYADLEDCWMACRDLAKRMGILCEPAELGKLNLNIGVNQRQNSPRFTPLFRRRIAKLPE